MSSTPHPLHQSNPAFLHNVLGGDTGDHSSTIASLTHEGLSENHSQFDEAENPNGAGDPNLAGDRPMKDLYTWRAGEMNAWQENDDYRRFGPGRMDCPQSRTTHQFESMYDGDYDDNGGHPVAEGHDVGYHYPADVSSKETGETNTLILRRI